MARKWQILLIVSLGTFMGSLDVFIVNVAFPAIRRDFPGTGLSALSWVLNGYAIVFAAFLVPAGRIADRIGHRRAFLFGLLIFTGGSALCGVAAGTALLVAARVVQAVGAALLTPTSLALILPAFPGGQRALAVGIWSAISGIAASIGPTVGGLLVQLSWRWVFFVNVPIGLLCAIATVRIVRETRDPEPGPRPDLLGAILLALSVAVLTLGIVEGQRWGWIGMRTPGAALAAVLLLAAFIFRSARHPAPVVDLSLLRIRSFVLACVGTAMIGAGLAAVLLSLILFMTTRWDYSVLRAGLGITPGPMMAGTFSILGGRLAGRVAPRLLTTIGALAFGAGGAWWIVFVGQQSQYARELLPGMLLTGIGVGLTWAPLTTVAAASLPLRRSATGLAVLGMARQIGTALGIAILVAIIGTPGHDTPLVIFRHGWLFIVGTAVLDGLAVSALRPALHGIPEEADDRPALPGLAPIGVEEGIAAVQSLDEFTDEKEAIMARTSRAEKARTRERLVAEASHAFRANGVAGTSIPTLMAGIGLTHGTFYAHFDSKDALVAEAYVRGLNETVERLLQRAESAPPGRGLNAVIDRYLSTEHRDDPAGGCPLPALAGEVRREPAAVRHAFTEELQRYFDRLAPLFADRDDEAHTDHALILASGMVGAVLLARAVDDPALSDRILGACRDFYTAAFAPLEDARSENSV